MPLWQRLAATVIAMLAASYLIGLMWLSMFNFAMPNYAAGLVGGIVALPVWEFMKRIGPKKK